MNSIEIFETIKSDCRNLLKDAFSGIDLPTFVIEPEHLIEFMKYIKNTPELSFDLITDITAVDYPNKTKRFELVYHIFSIKNSLRIRVKTNVEDGGSIESVTCIWKGAEWLEREVFDMFGVNFKNHPDLRRILMNEDYKYHPLKKEFPLQGYEES